jgi:Peptidase family M1 domain
MSSCQFLLAAGEFDQLSIQSNGIALGVAATPGKRGERRFALASAAQLLRYFNDYFGVKYPLPKLDLIALPDGSPGTVEHWGAITALESQLFCSMPQQARRLRAQSLTSGWQFRRPWPPGMIVGSTRRVCYRKLQPPFAFAKSGIKLSGRLTLGRPNLISAQS